MDLVFFYLYASNQFSMATSARSTRAPQQEVHYEYLHSDPDF